MFKKKHIVGTQPALKRLDQCHAVLNSLAKNNPLKKLFFITKTDWLMLNREITVVCSEKYSRNINTLPGQNTEFF